MIGFLHPAFLAAALAAAVPAILHLVRRREARRVPFPAMRYLRRAEQRHARRLKLRHLLLLATRVLIIVLAAVAAAGPLVGRGGAVDHRPTALAIVIDDSQSSTRLAGERRLLDLYVERARLALDLLNPDDRVALFSAVSPEAGAVTDDPAGARGYLQSLEPAAATADLSATIREAELWLQASEPSAHELHVLTDLQQVSISASLASLDSVRPAGRGVSALIWSPDLPPLPNGAPGDPIPAALPLTAGQQTDVSVPLVWHGPRRPTLPTVVRLVRGDDVIAIAEGAFGSSVPLRLPPQDSGWVQGYVETSRHGLAADDRRYYTWFARPAARVALLGEPGPFLEHAVETLSRAGRLRRVAPDEAEVWISAGGARIEAGLAAGVSVIVVPPVDPLALPRLNARLGRARVPWRYEARTGQGGSTRIGAGAPIAGLDGLEVRRSYSLVPAGLASGDTALLKLSAGEHWLIRGHTNGGASYLLLGSPLTAAASDVPVSAAMVPLVDALAGSWARLGVLEATAFEGGASIRLPPRARELVLPDGSRRRVEGGARLAVRGAGNYSVLDGERAVAAFSVNAPLQEGDLEQGRPQELERTLPAAEWTRVRETSLAAWERTIFRARRGRLAWRPLVALVLLVSIVEASVAAAGRRRNVRAAGADGGESDYRG